MICVFSVCFCIIIIITNQNHQHHHHKRSGSEGERDKGKGKKYPTPGNTETPRNTLASRLQIYQLLSGSLRKKRSCPHRTLLLFDSQEMLSCRFSMGFLRCTSGRHFIFFFWIVVGAAFCILCIYVFDISFIYLGLPRMCRSRSRSRSSNGTNHLRI